eukprot:6141227-Amphidinium_carterae.1
MLVCWFAIGRPACVRCGAVGSTTSKVAFLAQWCKLQLESLETSAVQDGYALLSARPQAPTLCQIGNLVLLTRARVCVCVCARSWAARRKQESALPGRLWRWRSKISS